MQQIGFVFMFLALGQSISGLARLAAMNEGRKNENRGAPCARRRHVDGDRLRWEAIKVPTVRLELGALVRL